MTGASDCNHDAPTPLSRACGTALRGFTSKTKKEKQSDAHGEFDNPRLDGARSPKRLPQVRQDIMGLARALGAGLTLE